MQVKQGIIYCLERGRDKRTRSNSSYKNILKKGTTRRCDERLFSMRQGYRSPIV